MRCGYKGFWMRFKRGGGENEEAGRRNLYPQQSLGLTVYTRGAEIFWVLYPKTANVKPPRKV